MCPTRYLGNWVGNGTKISPGDDVPLLLVVELSLSFSSSTYPRLRSFSAILWMADWGRVRVSASGDTAEFFRQRRCLGCKCWNLELRLGKMKKVAGTEKGLKRVLV